MSELAAFLGIAVVVIVTPGQDTALTIRNTLVGGRRSGVATAIGVAAGQACWTVAATAGIAALLLASEPAFTALKLLGAAYLVYLGWVALLNALRPRTRAEPRLVLDPDTPRFGHAHAAALRQGLLSNLANPKMAVFFTSLLPQFAPTGAGSAIVMVALGLVFCLMTFTWLTAYAIAVARAGDFLRRCRIRRIIDGLTGATLVALGIHLATRERA